MAKKLQKITPIDAISMELVNFDLQKMENPEIKGVEYQLGELQGYDVREYLLEKYGPKCAYCHKEDISIEVEHYYPKSRGGTDRVSNLTLTCRPCNEEKGNLLPEKWIEMLSKSRKELDKTRLKNFTEVGKSLKKPLKDATAVNATRWYLFNKLKVFGLSLEAGSGALTKMNRIKCGFEKQHYFDALCVGESTPEKISNNVKYHIIWSYSGRGNRKTARVDQYGFPLNHLDAEKYNKKGERKGHRVRTKEFKGFQTGDIVTANVTKGKKEGKYRGRVAIPHSGNFNIKNAVDGNTVQGISHKYCRILQKSDGWYYRKQKVS